MTKARFTLHERDLGWNKLRVLVEQLRRDGAHARAGYLDDGGEVDGLSVAQLAAVHEFGTDDGHVPARPHVQPAFDDNKETYISMLKVLLVKVYEGNMTVENVLGLIGAKMAADIKLYVTEGSNLEANAASTVAAKGSDRPLIDTARMVGSIAWAVIMKERNDAQ